MNLNNIVQTTVTNLDDMTLVLYAMNHKIMFNIFEPPIRQSKVLTTLILTESKVLSKWFNHNQNDGIVVCCKNEIACNTYEPNFPEANCLVSTIQNKITLISIYRSPVFKNTDTFINALHKLL